MVEIKNYEIFLEAQNANAILLASFSTKGCSVCHAIGPRVKELADELEIPLIKVDIEDAPMISGQFNVFTVPTVLLFFRGREYHRQSRFIDLYEIRRRGLELIEGMEPSTK